MNGTDDVSRRSKSGDAEERMTAAEGPENSHEAPMIELTIHNPKLIPLEDPFTSMLAQRLKATEAIGVFSTPALLM